MNAPVVLQAGGGVIVLVDVIDVRRDPARADDVAAAVAALPDEEQVLCARWAPRRQATFIAGRRALRLALVEAGVVGTVDDVGPIGRDDRGAPVLPFMPSMPGQGGLRVSITHKDTLAGALVCTGIDDDVTVGLDLELDDGRSRTDTDALARQVLLPHELGTLPAGDDDDATGARRRAMFERFSLKEALYKALDPFLRRYIGFTEVTVAIDDRGVAGFDGVFFADDGVLLATGDVVTVPGLPAVVLTTARVQRRR